MAVTLKTIASWNRRSLNLTVAGLPILVLVVVVVVATHEHPLSAPAVLLFPSLLLLLGHGPEQHELLPQLAVLGHQPGGRGRRRRRRRGGGSVSHVDRHHYSTEKTKKNGQEAGVISLHLFRWENPHLISYRTHTAHTRRLIKITHSLGHHITIVITGLLKQARLARATD